MTRSRLLTGAFFFGALIVGPPTVTGCLDGGLEPVARDTTPPRFEILSPIDTTYDLDSDHLVDFQLRWTDSGGAVDPSTARIRSLQGVNGSATPATDLLTVWPVDQQDSVGLSFHETLENLLHGGTTDVEVSVADTAGNLLVDTIQVSVPHGVFLKTLVTGLSSTVSHGIGMVVCVDDHRAYMTAGRNLVVVNADSLKVLGVFFNNQVGDDLNIPLCVSGDSALYVTQRVERFDRQSMTWLPRVTNSFGAVGIVQSRSDPNILYVGESITGGIALIDRAQAARIGSLPLPPAPPDEYVFDLEVLTGDTKIYATRFVEGGILVADPRTGQVLKRIGVGGPTWPDSGRTDAITLSADQRWLYVAVLDGDPRGVLEVNTLTDAVQRVLPLSAYVPQELALSPGGRRLFVTTQDRFVNSPSKNVLIEVVAWTVLEEFPRPRPAGQIRFDGGVAFHPNGKLVFVAHNLDVDVYLIRES